MVRFGSRRGPAVGGVLWGGAVGGSGGERTADVYMRLMDASVLERR